MTPTDLASKATQVIEGVFQSIGGTGSNPDVPEFRTQIENASPQQLAKANLQVAGLWNEIVEQAAEQGYDSIPQTTRDEVALVMEHSARLFTQAASRSGASA